MRVNKNGGRKEMVYLNIMLKIKLNGGENAE